MCLVLKPIAKGAIKSRVLDGRGNRHVYQLWRVAIGRLDHRQAARMPNGQVNCVGLVMRILGTWPCASGYVWHLQPDTNP